MGSEEFKTENTRKSCDLVLAEFSNRTVKISGAKIVLSRGGKVEGYKILK
jgi:hypothetical protein